MAVQESCGCAAQVALPLRPPTDYVSSSCCSMSFTRERPPGAEEAAAEAAEAAERLREKLRACQREARAAQEHAAAAAAGRCRRAEEDATRLQVRQGWVG